MRLSLMLPVTLALAAVLLPGCNKKEGDASAASSTSSGSTTTSSPSSDRPVDAGTLNLDAGQEIGAVYEAYLSPWQEPGEEKDTPGYIPSQFQSTTPSLLRAERKSRGVGRVRFTKDLSKAYIDVKIDGIKIPEINMFHIHCGRPDQLGPILVDFALTTDIQKNFTDDGVMSVEVRDEHIEAESHAGHGIIGEFTAGCPIVPGGKEKVKTIAGMEYIARKGELYFNLHTTGQTYFGDIRGRIVQVSGDDSTGAPVAENETPATESQDAAPSGDGHDGH
jgi:CHRD domain